MTQNVVRKTLVNSQSVINWVAGLGGQLWLTLIAGWISAFDELILQDSRRLYALSHKYADECAELRNAWDRYAVVKALYPDARHELNSIWLHAVDEAADVLNSHVAMMYCKWNYSLPRKAGIRRDELEKSMAITLMSIEMRTGILNKDTRYQLCRAVLSMATSKLLMTAIRPHAADCLVQWGEFPTGGLEE